MSFCGGTPNARIIKSFSMGTEENMLPHITFFWENDVYRESHELDMNREWRLYFDMEILDWVVEPFDG